MFQDHGSWKRRRVDNIQVEVESIMSDLSAWVDKAREAITEHGDEYGLPVLQEMLSKWEDRKPQLESLEKIGQGYVQEIITGIFMITCSCI